MHFILSNGECDIITADRTHSQMWHVHEAADKSWINNKDLNVESLIWFLFKYKKLKIIRFEKVFTDVTALNKWC